MTHPKMSLMLRLRHPSLNGCFTSLLSFPLSVLVLAESLEQHSHRKWMEILIYHQDIITRHLGMNTQKFTMIRLKFHFHAPSSTKIDRLFILPSTFLYLLFPIHIPPLGLAFVFEATCQILCPWM